MSITPPLEGKGVRPAAPLPFELAEMRRLLSVTTHLQPSDQPAWASLLAAALTNATNGIVISANVEDRPIVYCNPAFEELTGYSADEIVGRNCRFLQGEGTDLEATARMREAFQAGQRIDLVILNYKKGGAAFWNALNIGPIRNGDGAVTHFIGVQTDVTERVNAQRQLEQRAYTDVLTGLANRAQFMRELERDAFHPQMQGRFAVGFVDLDGFKAINDQYGHNAGDELLRQVGQRLREVVRSADLVARLAGDEFVLLLRGVKTQATLELIARRTLAAFRPPFMLGSAPVAVHASLGLVQHLPGEGCAGVLARADRAMYGAKRRGKNGFSLDVTAELHQPAS